MTEQTFGIFGWSRGGENPQPRVHLAAADDASAGICSSDSRGEPSEKDITLPECVDYELDVLGPIAERVNKDHSLFTPERMGKVPGGEFKKLGEADVNFSTGEITDIRFTETGDLYESMMRQHRTDPVDSQNHGDD
jgi:hypothetical protein